MRFVAASLLTFFATANAETLIGFLKKPPPALTDSASIAQKEFDRIESLTRETKGIAVFLPNNHAWRSDPAALKAILEEREGNTRYDLLLACADEVALDVGSNWESLKEYARANGGIVDSTYGKPYFLEGNHVCLADWQNGQYVKGECANVKLPPARLSDATVYEIDRIVLPSELEAAIEALKNQEN